MAVLAVQELVAFQASPGYRRSDEDNNENNEDNDEDNPSYPPAADHV